VRFYAYSEGGIWRITQADIRSWRPWHTAREKHTNTITRPGRYLLAVSRLMESPYQSIDDGRWYNLPNGIYQESDGPGLDSDEPGVFITSAEYLHEMVPIWQSALGMSPRYDAYR
jgi:hypothetical protein